MPGAAEFAFINSFRIQRFGEVQRLQVCVKVTVAECACRLVVWRSSVATTRFMYPSIMLILDQSLAFEHDKILIHILLSVHTFFS